MIELGESHIAIITMLTRYFTGLMVTQDMLGRHEPPAAIAAAIHVSPFFVKDYVAASAKFTPAEIDRAFGALLHADVQFKSSTIDIEVGLELLLYALLHGSPELARL
jgi:DNA polymerase III delta subunit